MLCIDCSIPFRKPNCRTVTRRVFTVHDFPSGQMQCSMPIAVLKDIFEAIRHASFRMASGRPVLISCDGKINENEINILTGGDSLRAVSCCMLCSTTRDATSETLAVMSPDSLNSIVSSNYDSCAKLIWGAAEDHHSTVLKRCMGDAKNAVIAMQPVTKSRDRRVRTAGHVTVRRSEPKRIVVRAHTGNYIGSTNSMEEEGIRGIFDQIVKEGRAAITTLVAD
eukprot:IDg12329t1